MKMFTAIEEYDIPRELSVCFSGHRPEKLPWGKREAGERFEEFLGSLENEIVRAYREGARYFLSGMAEGIDLIAAEAVLRLSASCPDMKLVSVFPYCRGISAKKREIAERAYRAVSLREGYVSSCFEERNRFLVRNSSRLICCFSGDMRSGTGMTLRMAKNEGIDVVIINV